MSDELPGFGITSFFICTARPFPIFPSSTRVGTYTILYVVYAHGDGCQHGIVDVLNGSNVLQVQSARQLQQYPFLTITESRWLPHIAPMRISQPKGPWRRRGRCGAPARLRGRRAGAPGTRPRGR